uniref:hypothetical protein n=1 Tax=Psychrobacter sp. DAB_AL32B TaxID=1028414 RepID=UPI000257190D|nr:hypothetical protein [Psychrobacter sp. DAB_AL32B]AFF18192.1 hypothetical protein [Psychrobacter sp. DAB_AL32B]
MSDDTTKQHLFALMAHAEEQQKNIDQTLDIINKQQAQIESLHKQLPNLAQQLFTDSLNGARTSIESDLSNHATKAAQDLRKASNNAIGAADAIKAESKSLSWKHAAIYVGGFTGFMFALLMAMLIYIPSLDDIADRRATIVELDDQGGNLDISRCNGELCARVMTKKCDFGASKDYCILDLKD